MLTGPIANNQSYLVDAASPYWALPSIYNQIVNNQLKLDPTLAQGAGSFNTLFGLPNGSGADGYNEAYNVGGLSTEVAAQNDSSKRLLDPVNSLTGPFYADAVYLTLPAPMALQMRRNYGTQNLADNELGFGWKINYVPFLSVSTNNNLIYAAEMDGTVLAYRQQAAPTNNL